jgi:hypothetical protein
MSHLRAHYRGGILSFPSQRTGLLTSCLRHHCFELARIHQIPVSGIFKDKLRLERYNVVEADVLMSRSGPILLHYPNS